VSPRGVPLSRPRMPVLAAREAAWLASRQSRSAPRRQQAPALAAKTGANGWELLQWGWHEVTVDNALAHAEACCGAETGTHDGTASIVIARASFKRVPCRTWPRQGLWHTGRSGTRTQDGHASPPTDREREHCRPRSRQGLCGTHTPASRAGSAIPQARSGGGPGADFLADTGCGNRRWVCSISIFWPYGHCP
jgi:hypothetical protein